jgi:hypothetical protein
MGENREDENTFEWPQPQERNPDPYADQKEYFQRWEERDRQRRRRALNSGLSIYEKARQYEPRRY